MAGSKTVYLEKKLLDHVLGKTTYTAPATFYVALSLSPFDPAATGSAMDEVTIGVGGYARVSNTNNTTNWPNATGGNPADKTNGIDLNFGTPSTNWGTVRSAYLCDASTGGNALYGADFTEEQSIISGTLFKIDAGTWSFQES